MASVVATKATSTTATAERSNTAAHAQIGQSSPEIPLRSLLLNWEGQTWTRNKTMEILRRAEKVDALVLRLIDEIDTNPKRKEGLTRAHT